MEDRDLVYSLPSVDRQKHTWFVERVSRPPMKRQVCHLQLREEKYKERVPDQPKEKTGPSSIRLFTGSRE